MSIRQHVALLISVAVFTGIPRLCWPRYYAAQFHKVAAMATELRAKEIESKWTLVSYDPKSSVNLEEAMIKTINWPSLNLSETQSAKLKARLKEVVRYLLKPNFQDYYRLKTKGLHYKFSPTGLASNLLAEANLDIAREPNPELRQVQRLWSHVHNRGGQEFVPELSAISLESVAAAISHTNSGQALLSGQVKRGFTIAVEALDPGFEYSPKARTNDDPLLLFDLGFMAKSAKTGKVGPMHLSLVWLEEDEDWALNRLIIDLWLGFWTLF